MSDDDNVNDQRDDVFPVDTLGIPILVDVVESGRNPSPVKTDEASNQLQNSSETDSEIPIVIDDADISLALYEEAEGERPHAARSADLDRLIEEISEDVTAEILKKIKPVIRKRVRKALHRYGEER